MDTNDKNFPQRRLQVTILSWDIIGGGGSSQGYPVSESSPSKENEDLEGPLNSSIVNETPHILRPTKRPTTSDSTRTAGNELE